MPYQKYKLIPGPPGKDGKDGAIGPVGPVGAPGLNGAQFKSVWSPEVTYASGELVFWNDIIYACRVGHINQEPPAWTTGVGIVPTLYWEQFSYVKLDTRTFVMVNPKSNDWSAKWYITEPKQIQKIIIECKYNPATTVTINLKRLGADAEVTVLGTYTTNTVIKSISDITSSFALAAGSFIWIELVGSPGSSSTISFTLCFV